MKPSKLLFILVFSANFIFAQQAGLKSIDEVIQGIDSLLEQIDQRTVNTPPAETGSPNLHR